MLDYTLVSPKATYRMPTPRDLPALAAMVQAFYRECQPGVEVAPQQVLSTVQELAADKGKGSFFVFECEGEPAGYAILIRYWSNELGGTVLVVDELFVEPSRRGKGIAGDFLGLLRKVAPEGTRALQAEVGRANRRAQGLLRKAGFLDTGRRVWSASWEA